MKDFEIRNYIKLNGEFVLMDDLPPEKRIEVSIAIQDKMMASVGYKRKAV